MKIASLIARYLLGLMFAVFGLNGFLHFINLPMPTGAAGQFMSALSTSHFMIAVFALQLVSAVLLIANRYVVFALILLGPLLVSILLYHGLMDPAGLPPGILASILWAIVAWDHRKYFTPLFVQKAESAG